MNKSPGLNAYLNLANVLLFQSPWLKWLFFIGLALASIGNILMQLWTGPIFGLILKIVAISGGVFIATAVLIMIVVLPGQILAINSSKLISILPGIKKLSLAALFIFCFICTLSLTIFTVLINKPVIPTHLFSAIFFVMSFMMTFNTVIAQRWQWAQFFVFMSIAAIPFTLIWLQSVSVLVSLGLNILLWGAFIAWWRVWRPTRFFKNFVGMNPIQMRALQERNRYSPEQGRIIASIFSWFRSLEKPLVNRMDAIAAHLMGTNLGWRGGLQGSLLIVAFFAVVAFVFCLLFGVEKTFKFFGHILYIFIFLMYSSINQVMLVTTYRNMPRIWLITQGSRFAILGMVEKIYFSTVAATALPIFIIHLALCFIFPYVFFDPIFAILLFLFGIQVLVITFYISIIIYVYPRINIDWMNWTNVAITVLSIVAVYIAGASWVDSRGQTICYAMMVIGVAFISILFLYMHVIRVWPRVNFLRPTN